MNGYKDIKSHIRRLIGSKALQPGDRLSPARELAGEMGVSYVTAHRALRELAQEGLVCREGRRGTFVAHRGDAQQYTLAVILHELGQLSTFPEFLDGIDQRIAQRGHRMQLHLTKYDVGRMREIVASLCRNPVDGVIYAPIGTEVDFIRLNQEFLGQFRERGIPFVVAGHCDLPELPEISGVSTNHYRGACDMTTHLIGLGHERIAMMYRAPNQDRQRAIDGFRRAMRDAGLPVHEEYMRCMPRGGSPRSEVKQLLHAKRRPTAFFAIRESDASEIIAGLGEMDLTVPRDAAVVAFGDSPMLRFLPIGLTTVHIRHAEEGDLLAGMLLDILDGRIEPPCRTELPARLIIRESCGGQRGTWTNDTNAAQRPLQPVTSGEPMLHGQPLSE